MPFVHIVGRRNHGKTTLITDLTAEFARRRVRVGAIKHASHAHQLDTPGKDSHRFHAAGADPTAIITSELVGIFVRRPDTDVYDRLEGLFRECDLVLVEGHIDGPGLKVEVWREEIGAPCLASGRGDIRAVISDDRPNVSVPVWPRAEIGGLAERMLALGRE